jgi:hypothetical protein
MHSMTIDGRGTFDADDVRALDRFEIRMDDNMKPNRNDIRRYRRLIRRMSGLPYVTKHMTEHNPLFNPQRLTVAFGR